MARGSWGRILTRRARARCPPRFDGESRGPRPAIAPGLQRMHFDLTDLRLAVAIAEANSLTRGAERCHLSVPAVSVRIKNLEETLGTKLMYRSSQGVTLTPAGQALVHHARLVLG